MWQKLFHIMEKGSQAHDPNTWLKLRHQHAAEATIAIKLKLRALAQRRRAPGGVLARPVQEHLHQAIHAVGARLDPLRGNVEARELVHELILHIATVVGLQLAEGSREALCDVRRHLRNRRRTSGESSK